MTTPLGRRIARQIKMAGPMPLAEYMHVCLADPVDGYYATQNPFGPKGDFTTAPEISQMFGELIGVWVLAAWQQLGKPSPLNLVELGPGRGTLMADLMCAAAISPEFIEAVQINLVETSKKLVSEQKKQLSSHKDKITWHTALEDVPDAPMILIANEFLDAIPFRQYVKAGNQWHERVVKLDENGAFTWGLGAGTLSRQFLPERAADEPEGSVFEVSPAREAFVETLAEHLVKSGGAALFIDYGHARSGFGDTFQAMKSHEYADPLSEPGLSDLSSHIDFEALARAAKRAGAIAKPLMTQGEFLLNLGLLERAGVLGTNQSKKIQNNLQSAVERLAHPQHMGGLFKAFAIAGSGNPLPPFDPA